MKKNTAGQKVGAQLLTAADGTAFTGSVTVYVTGDAATQAVGSVGSGACTHEGNGYHTYAPAQAETNYDLIAFTFVGVGAIPVTVQIFTSCDANVLTVEGTDATDVINAACDTAISDAALATASALAAAIIEINTNTDDQLDAYVGLGGNAFTNIPWNAAWDVEVQSEVADALTAYNVVATSNLPTNFALLSINGSGHIARVTLVDTTTTNTDMRGTDSAATAAALATAQGNITAILADTNELQTNQGNWVTATGFATAAALATAQADLDTITGANGVIIASGTQTFNLTGSITGNLSGSVGSVSGAVGSISGVTFPTNFATLGINASGHVSRVTLVDTTTTNTDMRGTDSALTTIGTNAPAGWINAAAIAAAALNGKGDWNIGKTGYSISGTLTTLDALDTAQDAQHATTQNLVTTIDTVVDAILVDTNELQTDWANGGRLDLLLDAATAGGGLDAAGVRAAVGLSSANLDTQLAAIVEDTGTTLPAAIATAQADLNIITGSDGVVIASGTQTFNMTGSITGNVSGSVGSISGVTFPTNFATLGINVSGHLNRVTLVDTTTTNTDMRGTDAALTTLGSNAPVGWLNAAAIAASALDNKGNWNVGKTGYSISGTLTTLDALDTAQDAQHAATQSLVTTIDTVVDTILGDTSELQTDWANGGRLDLLLDAAVSGGGLDAAGVRAAIGLASANLDTQLAAIVEDTGTTLPGVIATAQADLNIITGSDGVVIASGTQTFNVVGNITGNLTGSVGSVTGAINTASGTLTTLDALDAAQDAQHTATQSATTAAVAPVKTKTDQLEFNDGRVNAGLADADGLTELEFRQLLAACMLNKSVVLEISSTKRRVQFLSHDGNDVLLTVTYNPVDGARSNTVIA